MKIALVGRFKNGALVEVLQEKGWNQSRLAREVGVSQNIVSAWMLLKAMPQNSEVRARLEQVTGRLFEDLFPPDLCEVMALPLPKEVVAIREISVRELQEGLYRDALPSVEAALIGGEAIAEIATELCHVLKPHELQVIMRHFGLDGDDAESLSGIAKRRGLSRTRISDIYHGAMQKLQQPLQRKRLHEALQTYRACIQPPVSA